MAIAEPLVVGPWQKQGNYDPNPPYYSLGANFYTSPTFSPGANTLLVLQVNLSGGVSPNVTSVTNTGTALTWLKASDNGSQPYGKDRIETWYAWNTSAQTNITYTVNWTQTDGVNYTGHSRGLLRVLTGVDGTTPFGEASVGLAEGTASNPHTATPSMTVPTGGIVVGSFSDLSGHDPATFPMTTTTSDSDGNAQLNGVSTQDVLFFRRGIANPVSGSFAPSMGSTSPTGSMQWGFIVVNPQAAGTETASVTHSVTATTTIAGSKGGSGTHDVTLTSTISAGMTLTNSDVFYPVSTRIIERPDNYVAPWDATRGGPAAISKIAGESEAMSADLVAARQLGTGGPFVNISAAIAAIWSAISGKSAVGHGHGASEISVSSAGFDGNLTPAENTVQKVAQAVDDMAVGSGTPLPQGSFKMRVSSGTGAVENGTTDQAKFFFDLLDKVLNVNSATGGAGAVADGVTDDTAAINAKIAHFNANPDKYQVLWFPSQSYKVTGALSDITRPGLVKLGVGQPERYTLGYWGTRILQTSKTAHTFNVATDGLDFEGGLIWNSTYGDGNPLTGSWPHTLKTTALPTAGSAIHYKNPSGKTQGSMNSTVTGTHMYGFYRNVDIEHGNKITLEKCVFSSPVYENVRCANPGWYDAGTYKIRDCEFMVFTNYSSTPRAHIRWESGGGLHVAGCVFVSGLTYPGGLNDLTGEVEAAVDIYCTRSNSSGADATTTDFRVVDNHIESHGRGSTGAGVRVKVENDGSDTHIDRIIVTDNHFHTFQQGTQAYDAVRVEGPSTSMRLRQVVVTGNTMLGGNWGYAYSGNSTGYGVRLINVDTAIVSNVCNGFAGDLSQTGCLNVRSY